MMRSFVVMDSAMQAPDGPERVRAKMEAAGFLFVWADGLGIWVVAEPCYWQTTEHAAEYWQWDAGDKPHPKWPGVSQ
jgi:hypothetical protein